MARLALPKHLSGQVQAAVECLRSGGVVAFPTDTVYGLGVDFLSRQAVLRVLEMKGRPEHLGLPLLLAKVEALEEVAAELSEGAWRLARAFWPGALTLVVRRVPHIPDIITGGRDTVAVRVPGHPVPRALARGLGRPITGTSANRSGQPPARTAEEVRGQLGAWVDLVLTGGPVPGGRESTIVDLTGPEPRLLRAGAIPLEDVLTAHDGHPGRVRPRRVSV